MGKKLLNTNEFFDSFKSINDREEKEEIINEFKIEEKENLEENKKNTLEKAEKKVKKEETETEKKIPNENQIFFRTSQSIVEYVDMITLTTRISKKEFFNSIIIKDIKERFELEENISDEEALKFATKKCNELNKMLGRIAKK